MKTRSGIGAAVVLAVCAQGAHAGMIGPFFSIQATNELGSAEYVVEGPRALGERGGLVLDWVLDAPVALKSETGEIIGMLSEASVSAVTGGVSRTVGPTVTLNFVVSSGSATNFTVNSASLSFASVDPALATASAAVTVTDFNGEGAGLTGLHPGGKTYQAYYNDVGNVPATGTVFAGLVGPINAGAFQSASTSEGSGPFTPVGVPVSSMSARFSFGTEAGDSASGTSVFTLIPTPGVTALGLASVSLAFLRRRPASV